MSEQERDVETIREWEHVGMDCKIVKHPMGHYCGYVQVPGLEENYTTLNETIRVNGGVTYGPDEKGWYGFDCAHSWDKCVDENGEDWGRFPTEPLSDSVKVWGPDDVAGETEQLAEQLKEYNE